MYLCMSFSNRVKPDRSNHLIVFHLFKLMTMAFCRDTKYIMLLCVKKEYSPLLLKGI